MFPHSWEITNEGHMSDIGRCLHRRRQFSLRNTGEVGEGEEQEVDE